MKKTLLIGLLALSGATQAVDIHSARGMINAPDQPKTVVSYDLGVIDTLSALGVELAGVPENLYTPHLAIDATEKVGTLFEPDLEALNALQPDWIIVAARSASKADALMNIAPTADLTIDPAQTIEAALVRLDDLAKVFHQQARAKEIRQRIEQLQTSVKQKIPSDEKALMLLITGPKISAYGKASRGGWFSSELGFDLIDDEQVTSPHGEPVSFEYIVEANPDWLLVIDRAAAIGQKDVANAHSVLDNPLVAKTTAWQKGQVIYLDPSDMYISIGGVEGIERILNTIDEALSD